VTGGGGGLKELPVNLEKVKVKLTAWRQN